MNITKIRKRLTAIDTAIADLQQKKNQLIPKWLELQRKLHVFNDHIAKLKAEARKLRSNSREEDRADCDYQMMKAVDDGIPVERLAKNTGRSINSIRTTYGMAKHMELFEATFKTLPKVALETSVRDIPFTKRTKNVFRDAEIKTVGDLIKLSEMALLRYRNFGKCCLNEVKIFLKWQGLKLSIESPSQQLNDLLFEIGVRARPHNLQFPDKTDDPLDISA